MNSKEKKIRKNVLKLALSCRLEDIQIIDDVFIVKNKQYLVLTGAECKQKLGINPFIPKMRIKHELVVASAFIVQGLVEWCIYNTIDKNGRAFFIKEIR